MIRLSVSGGAAQAPSEEEGGAGKSNDFGERGGAEQRAENSARNASSRGSRVRGATTADLLLHNTTCREND